MIYQFKVVIFRGKMGDLTTTQDIFLLGKMVIQRSDVFGICHQQQPFGCLKRWYTPQHDFFFFSENVWIIYLMHYVMGISSAIVVLFGHYIYTYTICQLQMMDVMTQSVAACITTTGMKGGVHQKGLQFSLVTCHGAIVPYDIIMTKRLVGGFKLCSRHVRIPYTPPEQ